jgi:hypothetical protein
MRGPEWARRATYSPSSWEGSLGGHAPSCCFHLSRHATAGTQKATRIVASYRTMYFVPRF